MIGYNANFQVSDPAKRHDRSHALDFCLCVVKNVPRKYLAYGRCIIY